MTARYAAYFVPDPESPLWSFGTRVVGYDSYSGQAVPFIDELPFVVADWERLVRQPAVYGFHATLKAPFRLASGKTEKELLETTGAIAEALPRVALGHLCIEALGNFLALRPRASSLSLRELEAGLVTRLDGLRAPLRDEEIARRRPTTLTDRQRSNLNRWGYPFCLDDFRFHMTLAGPMDDAARDRALAALAALYASIDHEVHISDIAILKQSTPDLPFRVLQKFPLGAGEYLGLISKAFVLSHR